MNNWLLSWNADKWHWEDYEEAVEITKSGKVYSDCWTCNSRQPKVGERIYLIKLGNMPRGIIASGKVKSEVYEREHWDEAKREQGQLAKIIDVDFDHIVDYENDKILVQNELNKLFPNQTWSPIGSGISIQSEIIEELERVWNNVINNNVSKESVKHTVPTSVWLATAILSYEKYYSVEKPMIEDMCFRQKDIQTKAQEHCAQSVDSARISQWCNADHENNTYNYLRFISGPGGTERRLTAPGEFDYIKEYPDDLDKNERVSVGGKVISVEELMDFVNKEYKKLIDSSSVTMEIDFEAIENYLLTYAGFIYKKPEKAGEKSEEMQNIHDKGIYARECFNDLGKEAIKPFADYEIKSCSGWINQGQIVPDYFWVEYKKKGYGDRKSSISLFAWKTEKNVLFYLAVEARDSACSAEDFKKHNRLLYREMVKPELHYFVESKKDGYYRLDCSREEVIKKYEDGEFFKVRLQHDISGPYIGKLTSKIVKCIQDGIKKLEPYYEEVIREDNLQQINSNGMEFNKLEGEKKKTMNKNMILYGPPGTGKTYNTVLYAVSICDGIEITELEKKPYKDVLARYKELKDKEKRIAFTTFHQSYGYEEFIEGIKPILVDSDSSEDDFEKLEYSIKPGIFKEFCDRAKEKTVSYSFNSDVRKNPTVWKVSLEGSKSTPTKTDCFNNNRIRIGWPERDRYITDESEVYSAKERRILLDFQSEMQKGDLVVTLYDQFTIDAIGVVDGDYDWLEDGEKFPRCREVKWIVKDIREDIKELNHGKAMTSSTVYRLKVPPEEILKLAEKNNHESQVEVNNNQDNYIMIIDEINRGNISKIFGELITLIETTKREGEDEAMEAQLPYSGESFSVPNNVYILGTMNTADRSIALMDTALRRRFEFVEMMPKSSVLTKLGINMIEGIDIVRMLDTINERIEYLFDREHTIGHAYFTPLAKDKTINKLADIFQNAIIPLLQEYFYEDYSKIQLVLGDNGKEKDEFKFILDSKVNIKSIFKGDASEVDDLSDKKYKIQKEAFYIAESYKQIY